MRLLITTQAVDLDDPILGFFHSWIEHFSRRCDSVIVICLREGRHALPPNVRVVSLGKERGRGRFLRLAAFYRAIVGARREYDAVFVHMNPEYVMLGAPYWHLIGRRVGLWYTHKAVNARLRLATLLCDVVFTASKESFRLRSSKVRVMGHGIDTGFFTPDPDTVRGRHLLSVGRLMPTKRHDVAIRDAARRGAELRIAGEGPERARLESLAKELGAGVVFLGPLSQTQLRDEYRRAATLIHRSETGSLDKVVLEAAACGLPVDSSDPAISRMPLNIEYVRQEHSLERLVGAIMGFYAQRS